MKPFSRKMVVFSTFPRGSPGEAPILVGIPILIRPGARLSGVDFGPGTRKSGSEGQCALFPIFRHFMAQIGKKGALFAVYRISLGKS
jgi:hypothetical protein